MRLRSPIILPVLMAIAASPAATLAQGRYDGWPDVVERNRQATVLLRVESPDATPDYGSGVVFSSAGLVLTARHVLPSDAVIAAGNFRIDGLLGWGDASPDFSSAKRLLILWRSDRWDVAVLSFQQLPPNLRVVSAAVDVQQGSPLLVMGYPGGGGLMATEGVASGNSQDDLYATDAQVGRGNSGGPVFGRDGALLGIILEGARRGSDGNIVLGFFRLSGTILKAMTAELPGVTLSTGDAAVRVTPGPPNAPPREAITLGYGVDELKDDHPSPFDVSRRTYQRVFQAQSGYKIVGASFTAASANHVVSAPQADVANDGSTVKLQWDMESGPAIDRWRGWLAGNVTTRQVPR